MVYENMVRDLMFQTRGGDEEAFALLYENFFTPIYRYVYSKVSDKIEAEDLTQTIFLKAFQAGERLPKESQASLSYLFAIARNTLIDYYRKTKPVNLDAETAEHMFSQLPDGRKGPEQQIADSEQKNFLTRLLSKLKPEYKEVLEMKFLQELSNAEIAKALGKTEANIRQIQVRALRKLQTSIIM